MREQLVLILAYHFPPENVIGAARPFRWYKYLRRLGYACHVITAADVSSRPDLAATYICDPFLKNPHAGRGWQLELIVRKLLLPGVNGTRWSVGAAHAAAELIHRNPDMDITLLSTYPPLGTHLAAYWIARRYRVPWIADFRDPLAGNPGSGDINSFNAGIYRLVEQVVIASADQVIVNTDAIQSALRARYPKHAPKVHLIWNGFDPEEKLNPSPIPDRPRRVFRHIGELYEGRDISPLLLSIDRLIGTRRLDPASFQLHLVGPVRTGCLPPEQFVSQAEAQGWLKLTATQLPRTEAQQLMQSSDGLLLVQPHSAVQVPGKLFEYIQIGRPILAFVPPNSATERILSRSNILFRCAYSSSSTREFDERVLSFFDLPSESRPPSAWFDAEFNAESHAEALARLIDDSRKQPVNKALEPQRVHHTVVEHPRQ